MNIKVETWDKIAEFARVIAGLENVMWLASCFIWGAGFIILYQLHKLKFIKLLIWAEVGGVINWFWNNRISFTGNSLVTTEYSTEAHILTIATVDMLIRLIPLILGTVGAILALRHLLKIHKEKISQPEA
jgi:hypothetical protein